MFSGGCVPRILECRVDWLSISLASQTLSVPRSAPIAFSAAGRKGSGLRDYDWLLLAADVTGGCGVCSLEISELSDSGLSIRLSSVPFGLLESVNLFVWVVLTVSVRISQSCQALLPLPAEQKMRPRYHMHTYPGSVEEFAG